MGFFPEASLIQKAPISAVPRCGLCGLYKHCSSPKMKPTGTGKRKILIVGEAPGATEDREGKQFVGTSGKLLQRMLKRAGIVMRRDCRVTNAAICWPHDDKGKNKNVTDDQIEHCLPNLRKTIKEFNPEIIMPFGLPAVKAVLHDVWEEPFGNMTRWDGQIIPCQMLNAWVCPAFHPAYIAREEKFVKGANLVENLFQKTLNRAGKLEGRPWTKVPDYRSQVECLQDLDAIVDALTFFLDKGGPIAIDYETNMLKPESNEAAIVSASVCWRGKRTISFPYYGLMVRKMWKALLESDCPKIAHNVKFEDRWSHHNEIKVRNWIWCSMNEAHVIDNRKMISSLSFQSLIHLGMETYGAKISPYLSPEDDKKDSYERNNIHLLKIEDLLLYGGLDSLCTFKVAQKQRKQLRLDPF